MTSSLLARVGAVLDDAPPAPFVRLASLWIQVTGTWCNLECTHCLNSSGPREPWLKPLAPAAVRRAIAEGERLGSMEESFRAAPLYHSACVTCHQTGMTCKNY